MTQIGTAQHAETTGQVPTQPIAPSSHSAPAKSDGRGTPLRVVLYSHDTMGLGHKRRNQLIATAIAAAIPNANILMITGVHKQSNGSLPNGIDILTLPALYKEGHGLYRSRYLTLPIDELITLRSKTIRTALKCFNPDIFIVDNVPRGVRRELDRALQWVRQQDNIYCVLGLRDILDQPDVTRREWQKARNEDVIRRSFDAMWVYGDRSVYDLAQEYQLARDVAAKVRYVGYLDQTRRLDHLGPLARNPLTELNLPPGQLVLCCVGGGQDGAALAEAFMQADLPPNTNGVLLTGPFMPSKILPRLQEHLIQYPRKRILSFVDEPTQLLQQADAVIAMGGYNTTCEILSFAKRALIVPRVTPRQEQLIRATRLAQMGCLEVLHPDRLTPEALSAWLHCNPGQLSSALDSHPPAAADERSPIDFNGLERISSLIYALKCA
jgi:predicted glycosyltransferase